MKLKKKNEELQKQINQSINIKTSKWAAFKQEFKRNMSEVTTAIKNVSVRNFE